MNEVDEYAQRAHAQYLEERKALIDAAREASRTFDQAVLAFGSAVFGASVAFIKDVAPRPRPYTIPWLFTSWVCFTVGLLAVMLSFMFSQRACFFRVEEAEIQLRDSQAKPRRDVWGFWTHFCNISCLVLLFVGIACWIIFAGANLTNP